MSQASISDLRQDTILTPVFGERPDLGPARTGTRPKRVLMTVDAVGGIWRYAMELGRQLAGRGVSVVYLGFGPEPGPEQEAEAWEIGTLRWSDNPLDWMAENEAALRPVPDVIANMAVETGADVIHVNLLSQAAGLETDLPVVAVAHSCVTTWFRAVYGTEAPHALSWHHRINREGIARADAVVVPTAAHGALLQAVYGPQPHLHVAPNAVSNFDAKPHRASFVFAAGRWWDEGKNAATLDRAAEKVDWPVLMAGPVEGPNGAVCTLRNATHCGSLPYADIRRLMARAGVVVSPSIYEPFGLAALEAASAGTALVLADIPGYRELWDGAALFAQPNSPGAFAAAISRLTRDSDLRLQLGSRARSRANRFSLERQAGRMLDIYAQLPARNGSLAAAVDM